MEMCVKRDKVALPNGILIAFAVTVCASEGNEGNLCSAVKINSKFHSRLRTLIHINKMQMPKDDFPEIWRWLRFCKTVWPHINLIFE